MINQPSTRSSVDTAILLTSAVNYHFVLDAFFTLWQKYWPDCSLPFYFASAGSIQKYQTYGVKLLPVEKDPGFIELIIWALKQVPQNQVLLFQDDFFIEAAVDQARMLDYCQILQDNPDVGSIKLIPLSPKNTAQYTFEGGTKLQAIGRDGRYPFSFQTTLWRKKVLIDFFEHVQTRSVMLSETDETPSGASAPGTVRTWLNRDSTSALYRNRSGNPEHNGQELFRLFPDARFLAPLLSDSGSPDYLESVIPYKPTGVECGKLTRHSLQLFRKEGINVAAGYFQRESVFTDLIKRSTRFGQRLKRALHSGNAR